MQPDGKIDADETPLAALIRELRERTRPNDRAGKSAISRTRRGPATNGLNAIVVEHLFHAIALDDLHPAAKIVEAVWIDPASQHNLPLEPLTRRHVLPLLGAIHPDKGAHHV